MYRYGDGTPFPLDENFIETLTSAVECCTNAFGPLSDLDGRRERAKEMRREGDKELARLTDLEVTLTGALVAYLPVDKKAGLTQTVAAKISSGMKSAIAEARKQVAGKVSATEVLAVPKTAADGVLQALRPFFDVRTLPNTTWIMSWDVRGAEPAADAIATAGRLTAAFALSPDPYRAPIRVEQLGDGVIVHMMKKGVFGKAKPSPIDLGKYVMVAFERSTTDQVITLRETTNKSSSGLRFAIGDNGKATWVSITPAGDADGEPNPLDDDDVGPVSKLADRANAALKDLINRRTLVDLSLQSTSLAELEEPRLVPFEMLNQLTPLARSIRERSRMSGELVLKRDIGDGRREELFVPRSTLSQQYASLPAEYRRPFEDMGITGEETSPAIQIHRPPATPTKPPPPPGAKAAPDAKTIEIKND